MVNGLRESIVINLKENALCLLVKLPTPNY